MIRSSSMVKPELPGKLRDVIGTGRRPDGTADLVFGSVLNLNFVNSLFAV